MARDYKNRGGRKRATRRKTNGKDDQAPGWQWMASGLAIGLSVAVFVWVYDRRPGGVVMAAATRPVPAQVERNVSDEPEEVAERRPRFQFYDMLPKFEVVIPERESSVKADVPSVPLDQPGSYVLQAGSFRNYADADRMQATLAIQGLESTVQKVTIDDDSWHRVRIGPIHDLAELNRVRDRLRAASVDVLVIRVGE